MDEIEVKVTVRDKIAVGDGTRIVCGNSDYVVIFDLDGEWDELTTRTMRVRRYDGTYVDTLFVGNRVPLPIIENQTGIEIGIFAGDIHTTVGASFDCEKSILCGGGTPVPPTPSIYNQIITRLDDIDDHIAEEVEEYIETHPVTIQKASATQLGGIKVGANLTIDANGVLSVDTANAVEQDNTKPVTSAAVHVQIGNIEALLANI